MPEILVLGRLRQEDDYYLEQPGLQSKILCHAYTGGGGQLEVTEAPCPSVQVVRWDSS